MVKAPTPVKRYHENLIQTMRDIGRHQKWFTSPINLGGVTGEDGGSGIPIGGLIGQLIQSKVAYDTTEAESLYTPPSGQSLVDNLNHIRYNIAQRSPAIVVLDEGGQVASGVRELDFIGAPVTVEVASGYSDRVNVTISGTGGEGGGETVKVSSNDTVANYLEDKITAGTNITLAVLNEGANEELEITVSGIPADAYDILYKSGETVGEILDETITQGTLHTFTVTDDGGKDISWSASTIVTTSDIISINSGSDTCTDGAVNYLAWTSGNDLTLYSSDPGFGSVVFATIACQANDIWVIHEEPVLQNVLYNIQRGLQAAIPIYVHNGMEVSEDADGTNALDVVMSEGCFCHGLQDRHEVSQILSRSVDMVRWYHSAGVWTNDADAEIDTAYYDNGTNLVAISVNKYYKSLFFYSGEKIHWLYAQEEHNTEAQAILASPPNRPPGLHCCPPLTTYVYKANETVFEGGLRWDDVRPTLDISAGGIPALLEVQEDDATVNTNVTVLNFEGDVVVTDEGSGKVTVDISASGLTDTKQVKVSSNDTTEGYLEDKIVAGTNIGIATLNDGSNETLQITASGGGGGGDLSIEDEGGELTSAATSIDFVGNQITATNVGDDVTVTVSGIMVDAPEFVGVRTYKDTNETWPAGQGWRNIDFDAENYDSDNMWSVGAGHDTPSDGYYHTYAQVTFSGGLSTTNALQLGLFRDSSPIAMGYRGYHASADEVVTYIVATDYYYTAGQDAVLKLVVHDSSDQPVLLSGVANTFMCTHKIQAVIAEAEDTPVCCNVWVNDYNNSPTHNVWTEVDFDLERYDTDTMFTVGTDDSVVNINTTGYYNIKLQLIWHGLDETPFAIAQRIVLNGSTVLAQSYDLSVDNNGDRAEGNTLFAACDYPLSDGDEITAEIWYDRASDQGSIIRPGDGSSFMTLHRIGPN